jgi:hypothetical protein
MDGNSSCYLRLLAVSVTLGDYKNSTRKRIAKAFEKFLITMKIEKSRASLNPRARPS